MINLIIHLALFLIFPPFLLGVINKTKALFAGRKGAPFFQTYYDIFKLLRKGMVISSTTTWIFGAAPLITLSAVLTAGTLMPLGSSPALFSFTGDFLLFAYLFGLARFFTTTAALDTGSAFEGMGASREVTFAALTEPALFFAFLVLVKLSGSLTLTGMLSSNFDSLIYPGSTAPLVMVSIGLFIVFLTENSRIPVDDPNTHLELTMIHEVMILDHSGPLLGIIEYASSLKLFLLGSILLNIIIPAYTHSLWLNWFIFTMAMIGLSVIVGILESSIARLKMPRVPSLLIAAVLLCGSAFILLLR
ncbi:NADH-quinone oxidoreductase subunit H [Oceanispirochaeta sp.]|jgi:formate hydrogenlyase subunit 4|uniref:respiratory chain complex I subunit 1 family protein n=1 Tax=Oceanispirochaeta sp. TaxID=2035350 RepID=UPI00261EB545|nr:NADH-quinone oxidoreductase subunit H [Oceanispirochaeta sp.]MDA3955262.1 NADH-quinone oxidoreductase subunit H [Oceanispirochaeta sp.]